MITTRPRQITEPNAIPWASFVEDSTQEVTGAGLWCSACESWIDVLSERALRGAVCNELGDWRCFKCGIERRAVVPRQRPDGAAIEVVIPEEYADASIEHIPAKQRQVLRQWPKTKSFMVIGGIPGSGKTRATWAYVKAGAQKGHRVLRLDALNAQSAWSGALNPSSRKRIQDTWMSAAYLILDDLSGCNPTDAWTKLIHEVLQTRLIGKKPTLITSAAGPEALRKAYNEAIHGRMTEFEWVYLPSTDWRTVKAEKRAKEEKAEAKA